MRMRERIVKWGVRMRELMGGEKADSGGGGGERADRKGRTSGREN